ncbi:efflux RND transporter periplasmic adaptor subunit [Shewanella ulleungensis]|uniref:MexH family multidrug efflux RND transporter periplasmic adaptor subunit n=1 Tax=Shewanella ulleungensis TaxID=2282699 RepID=A0ABQ2QHB7_9GAMM|nr:efflux RND transporter periplasmic adaptor subunit [Shewanella ulleungensis]MCL1149678.1 efflux RND transporter periplasmic adaptor subunit [Shewanella ulleungensis]GGP80692.1 MexH family multidrug efflux RND transporter periplasmic adaptor subunit [Shewanella ulleungensis]
MIIKHGLNTLSTALIIFTTSVLSVSATAAPKPQRVEKVVPVVTASVEQHDLSQSITLIGKLAATDSVMIAPQVGGKINTITVTSNQHVSKGQVLLSLDDSKAKASVLEAQAYHKDEVRKLNEFLKLINVNAITQTEIEAQKSSVDIALARLQSAQTDLAYHTLVAPFSGNTGLINFSRGKMVSMNEELLSLDNLSVLQLDLQVPEHYLSLLSTGMPVNAISRAWAKDTFIGNIIAIDPRVNEQTLNLNIRSQFDNQHGKLKPGMMMSATLTFPSVSAPIVPVQALEYSGTKRFVYVINQDNIAKRTEVVLGARIKDQVLIESGINIGDNIVVQGLVNMRDGIKVNDLAHQNTANQTHAKIAPTQERK